VGSAVGGTVGRGGGVFLLSVPSSLLPALRPRGAHAAPRPPQAVFIGAVLPDHDEKEVLVCAPPGLIGHAASSPRTNRTRRVLTPY